MSHLRSLTVALALLSLPMILPAQSSEITRYARAVERTADSVMLLLAKSAPLAIDFDRVAGDTAAARVRESAILPIRARRKQLKTEFDLLVPPREFEKAHAALQGPLQSAIESAVVIYNTALTCAVDVSQCPEEGKAALVARIGYVQAVSDYVLARNRLAAMVRAAGVRMPDRPVGWAEEGKPR